MKFYMIDRYGNKAKNLMTGEVIIFDTEKEEDRFLIRARLNAGWRKEEVK